MKNKLKKISTIVSCFLVITMFVSLCAVAYFNHASEVKSGNYTFVDVSIDSSVTIEDKAPLSTFDGYDKNGYYFSIDKAVERTKLKYDARITNTGDRDILAFLVINLPVYDVSSYANTIISLPFEDMNSDDWYLVGGSTDIPVGSGQYFQQYILGYRDYLAPGETTTSPFDYVVSKPMLKPYNKPGYEPDPQTNYTKFLIQNFAIGAQTVHDSMLINFTDRYDSFHQIAPRTAAFDEQLVDVFRNGIEAELIQYFVEGSTVKQHEFYNK